MYVYIKGHSGFIITVYMVHYYCLHGLFISHVNVVDTKENTYKRMYWLHSYCLYGLFISHVNAVKTKEKYIHTQIFAHNFLNIQ